MSELLPGQPDFSFVPDWRRRAEQAEQQIARQIGVIVTHSERVQELEQQVARLTGALDWIAGHEGFGPVPATVLAREMQERARAALASPDTKE